MLNGCRCQNTAGPGGCPIHAPPGIAALQEVYGTPCPNCAPVAAERDQLKAEAERYKLIAQQGHPSPCDLGPLCPYCEVERLILELAKAKEFVKRVAEATFSSETNLTGALFSLSDEAKELYSGCTVEQVFKALKGESV